jgi:hypothetical protein
VNVSQRIRDHLPSLYLRVYRLTAYGVAGAGMCLSVTVCVSLSLSLSLSPPSLSHTH